MSTRPEPVDLLDLGVRAGRQAADLVRGRAVDGVSVAATKSSPTDVVTEADRASETLIRELILAERPGDTIFGEEEGESAAATASGVRWVVDPIDGTVNFLYGLERYAVSIAAERDGVALAGVVIDVARRVEYTAYRSADGVIARRDGRPIAVRAEAPLSQWLVATGFSYDAGLRAIQADAVARLLPRVRDIRRLGSAALDICGVADGSLDAYAEEGVHEWDHAAAALIAEGAGALGEVTSGAGGRRFYWCAPAYGASAFRALVDEVGLLG